MGSPPRGALAGQAGPDRPGEDRAAPSCRGWGWHGWAHTLPRPRVGRCSIKQPPCPPAPATCLSHASSVPGAAPRAHKGAAKGPAALPSPHLPDQRQLTRRPGAAAVSPVPTEGTVGLKGAVPKMVRLEAQMVPGSLCFLWGVAEQSLFPLTVPSGPCFGQSPWVEEAPGWKIWVSLQHREGPDPGSQCRTCLGGPLQATMPR